MSDLVEHQKQFSRMLGKLLVFITDKTKYSCTLGEVWRTEEQAALNAKKGVGIKNSLHCSRLAIDINFFLGEELVATPLQIVEYWESIGGAAGYRFGDNPHFSLAYGGRK
jgi:hypothetical protein